MLCVCETKRQVHVALAPRMMSSDGTRPQHNSWAECNIDIISARFIDDDDPSAFKEILSTTLIRYRHQPVYTSTYSTADIIFTPDLLIMMISYTICLRTIALTCCRDIVDAIFGSITKHLPRKSVICQSSIVLYGPRSCLPPSLGCWDIWKPSRCMLDHPRSRLQCNIFSI